MSTTEQRTPETAADPAGVTGWAVPGVGPSGPGRPGFSAAGRTAATVPINASTPSTNASPPPLCTPPCVIDGCPRPATRCHFHHPHQFAQGGPTSVKNSAPLCPYHHGLAHSSHWQFTWDGHTGRLTRIPRK